MRSFHISVLAEKLCILLNDLKFIENYSENDKRYDKNKYNLMYKLIIFSVITINQIRVY